MMIVFGWAMLDNECAWGHEDGDKRLPQLNDALGTTRSNSK